MKKIPIPRHERSWPEVFSCPYHNADFPAPAEAIERGRSGKQHVRCPRCGRHVWMRDFYTCRATDGRMRQFVKDLK